MRSQDTIFAISSGVGKAAIAVIRVSGPQAAMALRALAGSVPKPRSASLRKLRRPGTDDVLDQALVLWLPGPDNATGEDMVELHVHGSRAVTAAVLSALSQVDGLRLAEPGEFSRRSFENGKLDLTEVEGLSLLIDAETEAQRRHAVRHAAGEAGRKYESWRSGLIAIQGLVEASIDFSDEEDVAKDAFERAHEQAASLAAELNGFLQASIRGQILREGFRIALVGAPNAGKSSLLNALAQRDVAIVSEEAGTTRDVIEVHLDLGGYPVVLSDTAGIREAVGTVEREGIRRALAIAADADLVIWLWDVTTGQSSVPVELRQRDKQSIIMVASKIDLLANPTTSAEAQAALGLSTLTGEGITELITELQGRVAGEFAAGEGIVAATLRQERCLADALEGLQAFLSGDDSDVELRAEDLRASATALGRLTGRIDVEHLLDEIFNRFCIGK